MSPKQGAARSETVGVQSLAGRGPGSSKHILSTGGRGKGRVRSLPSGSDSIFPPPLPYLSRDLMSPGSTEKRERQGQI